MKTLYWDFYGGAGPGKAEHFRKHLDEFLAREKIDGCTTGFEPDPSGRKGTAWCKAPDDAVEKLKAALRPQRIV
ncbi:MAG: hypothetical protein AAGA56_22085 [Myxococcota bacterium]